MGLKCRMKGTSLVVYKDYKKFFWFPMLFIYLWTASCGKEQKTDINTNQDSGCTEGKCDSDQPTDQPSDEPVPIDCGEQEYAPFVLEALEFVPDIELLQSVFPEVSSSFEPKPDAPNIRLDTCVFIDGSIEVKQLAYLQLPQQGTPYFYELITDAIGIQEAVFGKSQEFVDAHFSNGIGKYWLKGFRQEEETFVASVHYSETDGKKRFDRPMVGRFVFGDFYSPEGCNAGEEKRFAATSFEISSGSISEEITYCAWGFGMGTGTTYYRIIKYAVTDTSELLPEELRGKKIELTAEQIEAGDVFRYQQNHHNSCDSYEIILDSVIYAYTNPETLTMDNGCEAFGYAPARTRDEPTEQRKEKTAYRIKYQDNPWIQGFVKKEF